MTMVFSPFRIPFVSSKLLCANERGRVMHRKESFKERAGAGRTREFVKGEY